MFAGTKRVHAMVNVMKAFVRIVVDQDEQLHSTVRVRAKRSSTSCVRQSVPRSNIGPNIEHMQCC